MRNDLYNHLPALQEKVPKHHIWIHNLLQRIQKLREKGHNRFIISDVRFTDEADAICGFGGQLVKISRNKIDYTDEHSSEININSINPNLITCGIINDDDMVYYHAKIEHVMKKHFNMDMMIEPPSTKKVQLLFYLQCLTH